jgi:23S rRNA (uracil1939-C5)-methyltransferase
VKPRTTPVPRGRELDVRIDRLATGGRGVARLDGRVVFVDGAVVPGELVSVSVLSDKGRFLEAVLTRVVESSARRVSPRCAHFGTCGGCSWQHLSYPDQIEAKKGLLEDSLARLGKLASWPSIEIVHGEPWGTRNRAQFQPGAPGRPWGFFESGSRRTVSLAECPVLSDELQGVWNDLRDVEADPMAERRERAAFAWGAQGTRLVCLPGGESPVAEVSILGRSFRFPVDGFFQSNVSLLPRMVELALDGLSGRRALDLYCGVGLFAAFLEDRFEIVDAVESDPRASRFGPGNLRRARYHDAFAEDWLESELASGRLADVDAVVVDPPRQGLTERAIRAIVSIAPRELRYVSCGHDTLARDLRRLVDAGYSLRNLAMVDLYPQTPHLEVVCALTTV